MTRLRLAFMGTPDFAVPTLAALIEAGHDLAAVYTQPARPAGRGQRERVAPVEAYARARAIPVRTPRTLKDPNEQAAFAALGLDAAVVAAYGLILPPAILAAPRLGCINVHASLLPRWRGAAPIQWAIMAGDRETGIAIMVMEAGLDTGPVLAVEKVAIGPATTGGSLHDTLAALGGPLAARTLAAFAAGTLQAVPQPAAGVTYARKLTPADGALDWCKPALDLERQIRALAPQPCAWFTHGGERIKVFAAAVAGGARGVAGHVLDADLTVACGEGALRLLKLQRPGRSALGGGEFLRGYPIAAGTRLDLPVPAP